MDKWVFIPLETIGDIKFGMNRIEVRALFKNKYEEFKKTSNSDNTTDDFGDFHVYYDSNNNVEAVEIFENIEVLYEGKVIFPISIDEIKRIFNDITIEDDYYTHYEKSIGYTTSDDEVEGVLFGNKDYYN